MSPKKPVENLRSLTLKTAKDLTLDCIKSGGESSVEELRVYFKKLPRNLSDALLIAVLNVSPLSSYSKWVAFSAFDFKCSVFDCRMLSPKFHEKFLDNLTNARHLNLTDAQINEKSLRKLIKRCPNLRSLVIPNLATDKVLKEVRNLQKLELLDISSNAVLSPTGLTYIDNKNLKVLNIGTPLTFSIANYEGYDTLTEILQQLPNLTQVRTYEYTGRALLELKKPFVSKLKMISDCDTGVDQMVAIISACPYLEDLFLENPEDEVFEMLRELRELKKLRVSKFCERPVTLRVRGLTLETLEVKRMIIDMCELCLTLESLLARSCFVFKSLNEDVYLRNLRIIEFIDCDTTRSIIFPLLQHCDKLQRLAVSNDTGLTDSDIRTLCQEQRLKHLEELWLSLAKNLTSDSVILLMNHCDNLRILGTLNGWNVEKVEVNYLRCVIYFTNTNLNLLHFSCF